MTNYNDGNWHGYNGQDLSSIHQLSEIEAIWFGSCSLGTGRRQRGEHVWAGTVAFRVTKEYREPISGYVRPDCIQYDTPDDCDMHKFIHVREVLE